MLDGGKAVRAAVARLAIAVERHVAAQRAAVTTPTTTEPAATLATVN